MKRVVLLMAGLLLLCAAAMVADGPETGLISGVVTDSSGNAMPGVTVTLRGPMGEKVLHTEGDGTYRFGLVRPGRYTVTAELEGFLSKQVAAEVAAGGRAAVDLSLELGTSEEITVTSEAPLVDKFNVTVGGSVKAETVQEIAPVNRGIYGSINVLPGVANDQESVDLSSSRPSFNGTSWQESAVFIDGVDTTFVRYGATRMLLPNAALTEVNLQTSGSGADYGRFVGGVTNAIVRSGTNQFHGELTGIYTNLEWDANFDPHQEFESHPSRPRPADFFVLTDQERNVDKLNYEVSFGGPIKRDKAWFFLASSEFGTFTRDRTLAGDLIDQSTDSESYIAKLNFQPAAEHSLAASWIATPITRLFQLDSFADPYVPTMHDIGGSLISASWNWSASRSYFLETKLAHHTSSENKLLNPCLCTDPAEALALKQQDPRFAPTPQLANRPFSPVNNFDAYLDNADGTWHNGWLLDNGFGTNEYPRDQANIGLTQFVGQNHELKYGIDWQQTEWEQDVRRTNFFVGTGFVAQSPFGFTTPTARLNYNPADVVAAGKGSGTATAENLGLYLRDRFSIGDHWTFNLGLRLEDQVHENDIGRTVIDSADFSPRATAVYDVKGNGRMLFNASAGRYHTHIPQELINTYLLDEWNGFNAHDRFFYIAALGGYVFPIGGVRPGAMWDLVDQGVLDVEIDPYGRDELILGWEWQFSDNWATKVRGIAWETFNQIGAGLTQLGPNRRLIQITENVKDIADVMRSYGWVDLFVAD
ncbi:MAG TPA: TonB-dependent receptor, partial [Thermoanaerobaculia bacterium]|nr:TonB-dependent receptor [Thermoanaerobaculia bacterium]